MCSPLHLIALLCFTLARTGPVLPAPAPLPRPGDSQPQDPTAHTTPSPKVPVPTREAELRAVIYVDDDADPDWYDATHVPTVQQGVDVASTNDTVYVYSGTYYENVTIDHHY